MTTFSQHEPLTDAELDRLGDFLKSCKGGEAMNLEELDGFFASLIAGPETVMPSEYYAKVFGGEMSEACEFGSLDEANEILGLMMRHWNDIAGTLFKDEPYVPLLLEDEAGVAHGNDWARGFMRGMEMRHDGWAELVNDEDHGGCVIPMMALCHEHDEDPEMRPEPIGPEKREEIIVHMAAGLMGAYRYFRAHREANAGIGTTRPRRSTPKVGRNDPCPCGSGRKYKKCGPKSPKTSAMWSWRSHDRKPRRRMPRQAGTTLARAAPGRNTRSAAEGRRSTERLPPGSTARKCRPPQCDN